jgi:hypothetical protein
MRAINLVPAEQRRGAGGLAGRTGGIVYVVLAALVALVIVGVLYAVAVHQVASRTTTLEQVNDETAAVTGQVNALAPFVQFQTLSRGRVGDVASLAAERFDWPAAMTQIALALPSTVTLDSLAGTASGGGSAVAAGVSGTGVTGAVGVTVNAPTLSLTGCAAGSPPQGQVEVAETLTRIRALEGVTSAFVPSYATAGSCVQFNMTVTYGNDYGIPTPALKAGSDSTVGS